MVDLEIEKKFKACNTSYQIRLSQSLNGKSYISVSSNGQLIGIPLSDEDVKKIIDWLQNYVEES